MNVGFLILAHNTPDQLQRLVARLDHPDHYFFIHIDAKADIEPFLASGLAAQNVTLVEDRGKVFWGDFSASVVVLGLLRTILSGEPKIDRFVLLSGSDYPLDSAENINAFFRDNPDREYIDRKPMPNEGQPISRLELFHVSDAMPLILRRLFSLRSKLGLGSLKRNYRKGLNGLLPFSGAQWWAITREAALYATRFAAENPKTIAFFKRTYIPDEHFFNTVVGNWPKPDRIEPTLTFADWRRNGPHPELIDGDHLTFFRTSTGPEARKRGERPYLFARKFHNDAAPLARQIDEIIGARAIT